MRHPKPSHGRFVEPLLADRSIFKRGRRHRRYNDAGADRGQTSVRAEVKGVPEGTMKVSVRLTFRQMSECAPVADQRMRPPAALKGGMVPPGFRSV